MVGASVHARGAADQHLDLGGSLFDPWRTGTAMRDCAILFRVCVTHYSGSMCSDLIRIGLVFGYCLSYNWDVARGVRVRRVELCIGELANRVCSIVLFNIESAFEFADYSRFAIRLDLQRVRDLRLDAIQTLDCRSPQRCQEATPSRIRMLSMTPPSCCR
jgi:hypothetical protein